jgi:hypothetical protein
MALQLGQWHRPQVTGPQLHAPFDGLSRRRRHERTHYIHRISNLGIVAPHNGSRQVDQNSARFVIQLDGSVVITTGTERNITFGCFRSGVKLAVTIFRRALGAQF